MPSGDAVDPRWSPNGEYIAFVHVPSGGLTGTQDSTHQRIIYLVELATKRLTRLSR
jgi:Tol biopolymer transport system component